ncbi:MAG: hypothetical protein JNK15_05970 [Planctomycetes bacterium]|nr:hypothetical protein [Planctomycetota bacterium]
MSRSSLLSLSAALGCFGLLLASPAAAQCFDPSVLGTAVTGGGDVISGHVPLGFAFPMPGSAGSGSWTHVRICTNGWLALTDGVSSVGIPSPYNYGSVAVGYANSLYGPAGSNPRIAPYWTDLTMTGVGGIFIDNLTTPGSSTRITWYGAQEYGWANSKTFQAELYATGAVALRYWGTAANQGSIVCGLSAANGTGAQPQCDLVPGPATTQVPGMHQVFAVGTQDLDWMEITFTPQGGGYHEVLTCGMQANHTNYGSGCYTTPAQGFYEHFPTAAQASTALAWNSVQFTIAGGSYAAAWQPFGGTSYIQPSGNVYSLPSSDDGSHLVQLTYPLPTPDGPVTHLRVNHNGVVHFGSANASPHDGDFTPSGAEFAACNLAGFYCWHDFVDAQLGVGITYEQVGNLFVLTWPGVESYASPETGNPTFLQFQFDLLTGTVRMLWLSVSPNSTSLRGSSFLVGYKGLGPIADPGSAPLTTTLPGSFRFGITPPMSLWATPAPISTVNTGTTVTYTHDWVPEFAPGSRLGLTILSLGQDLPGTSLAGIGMPGCSFHLASIDATLLFATTSPTPTTAFTLPPGILSGTRLYAQAAALVPSGSANALGVVLSDALASTISWY